MAGALVSTRRYRVGVAPVKQVPGQGMVCDSRERGVILQHAVPSSASLLPRPTHDMNEHHLAVRRSARYYTHGPLDESVSQVWIVCHGFAQLAGRFMRHFVPLDGGSRLIVAPEALNRFYIEQTPGPHGPDSKVGATWMTREDRLIEIEDYVAYLDALCDEIFAKIPRERVALTVLGFSQGVATVCRWTVQGRTRPDHLILWAERLPPEIDLGAGAEELAAVPRLSIVAGLKDLDVQRVLPLEKERLLRLGLRHAWLSFDGGHEIDEETLRKLAQ